LRSRSSRAAKRERRWPPIGRLLREPPFRQRSRTRCTQTRLTSKRRAMAVGRSPRPALAAPGRTNPENTCACFPSSTDREGLAQECIYLNQKRSTLLPRAERRKTSGIDGSYYTIPSAHSLARETRQEIRAFAMLGEFSQELTRARPAKPLLGAHMPPQHRRQLT
jgi:hypothetical protein